MLLKFTALINFSCFSSVEKIIQKKLQYFSRTTYETTPEYYQAQKAPSEDSILPKPSPRKTSSG